MGILEGKVCVITGGAGSLGLASARVLQHEGAKTMLVDLDDTDLRRALATLDPNKTAMTVADVTQANQVQDYLDRTVRKWGKIDVLFSNAGISGVVAPVTDYPDEMFDQVIAVHVRGAFLACKYGLPHMKDGGSIIITSSVVGVRGGGGGTVAYVTAKHAQVGLMRDVAREAACRAIRVNTLHPGPIDNDFQLGIEQGISKIIGRDATQLLNENIPLKRHATPDEVARSVLYLASDLSSFTTGTTLMVDGGSNS